MVRSQVLRYGFTIRYTDTLLDVALKARIFSFTYMRAHITLSDLCTSDPVLIRNCRCCRHKRFFFIMLDIALNKCMCVHCLLYFFGLCALFEFLNRTQLLRLFLRVSGRNFRVCHGRSIGVLPSDNKLPRIFNNVHCDEHKHYE